MSTPNTAYHGGTTPVTQPLCKLGRANLDFGPGFYVTHLRQQAESWARRQALERNLISVVSVYRLDTDTLHSRYRCLVFESYDQSWLRFIVASRNGQAPWQGYDAVEGGVADDRVVDTVNLYMLDLITPELALQRLAQHQPNNQLCILSQSAIDECLSFRSAYTVQQEGGQK